MNKENMIKLTAFYPFSNFLRVTQEFYEDKAIIKSKSIKSEWEYEFNYKDVDKISYKFEALNDQQHFGFFLTLLSGSAQSINYFLLSNLIPELPLHLLINFLLFCGIYLFTTSFIKYWHIVLLDTNNYILVKIRENKGNRETISKIKEMIKNTSKNLGEISSATPFPDTVPVFEYKYFGDGYLTRIVDRFYENEIIRFIKNIYIESCYVIKYSELTNSVERGRLGIDMPVWEYVLFLSSAILGLFYGFIIPMNRTTFLTISSLFGLGLLISWVLTFIKRDVFSLNNKNGQSAYLAYINKNEKEKVEKIIEYVKSRIPEENKE